MILFLNKWQEPADCSHFEAAISNLWHEGKQGLLSRNRGRPDQDAWDNYLGACVGGLFVDKLSVPRAIRAYGERHFWTFRNEDGFSNLIKGTLFRFPGLVPTIKLCASDARPPCNIELAGMGYRLGDHADNPGAARTKWLMALTVYYAYGPSQHKGLREKAAFQLRCINARWGSIRGVMEAYHGPMHPFALVDIPTPAWLTKESK